jgi:hypothetical protein
MKRANCLMVLGVAIAVNAAALMAVNSAMVEAAERELLSQQQPLHVVVITAKREDLQGNQTVASQNCASADAGDADATPGALGARSAAGGAPL